MSFDPPRSLSPSKVTSFRDCALAFRFNSIEHLPDQPTVWTVKGTLVHRVLERLFWLHERGDRSPEAADAELVTAWDELQTDPDFVALALTAAEAEDLRADAEALVQNYFALEDPNEVNPVGVELTLEARVGDMRLARDHRPAGSDPRRRAGGHRLQDRAGPGPAFEQSKLVGVHIYALLCQEVLGRRPVQVRLLHLKEPMTITAEPSEQALRGQRQKAVAVWSAIERACENEDFRPRTSPLCNYCRFREFCPAYGGRPEQAAVVLGGADRRSGMTIPGPPIPWTRPIPTLPPDSGRIRPGSTDRLGGPAAGPSPTWCTSSMPGSTAGSSRGAGIRASTVRPR